jgi:transposase
MPPKIQSQTQKNRSESPTDSGEEPYLLDLGIAPVIPSKENEDRDARPVEFDKEVYRRRNIIERLKESRRIFSRYEKKAKNFGGMITLAFIRQYLRYELV